MTIEPGLKGEGVAGEEPSRQREELVERPGVGSYL